MKNIKFDISSYVCLAGKTIFTKEKAFFDLNCLLSLGFKMQNQVIYQYFC